MKALYSLVIATKKLDGKQRPALEPVAFEDIYYVVANKYRNC
jgi:hypothetical protein